MLGKDIHLSTEKKRLTFISYSRDNEDFALRLARELKTAGFSIWLDQLDIPAGARWDDALERALDACEIFMVILTPTSIASENVKDEIGFAIDHKKRILPVLLQEARVPLRLRRFQYIDFTSKSYDEGVEAAKHLLGNLVNQPTTPRPSLKKTAKDQQKEDTNKEKLKTEQEKAARLEAEEAKRKEAMRIASEKAESERKAKVAAATPPVGKKPTAEKTPFEKARENPAMLYGSIAVIVILFIIILASTLSGGKTPATLAPTETRTPTQATAPTNTPTPTYAPPTATLLPTATPTFAPPVTPYVRIIEITLDDNQYYVVEYETFGYTEALPGIHIHFFFDTVPPEQAGSPGSGPWVVYGGPRPFTKYAVTDRPTYATKMCALVANENHTVQYDSGNCVDLP